MENPVEINLRPLRLGEILDGAVGLYRHNFWLLVGIIALAEIPLLLVQVALPLMHPQTAGDSSSLFWWITTAASMVMRWFFVDGLGAAALSYAIARRYLRQPASILDAYRRLGSSWFSMAVFLLFFPAILVGVLIWGFVPCAGWISGAGIFIFLSMAVMPLIPVVIMVEGQPILKAMLRAWDLTRRRFFWILGFNMVMAVFSWTLAVGPSLVAGLLVTALIGTSLGNVQQTTESFYSLISSVSGTLFNMLFLPIQVGAWTLIYYDLRVRTEAFDLALLVVDEPEQANRLVRLPPLEKWFSGNDIARLILTSLLVAAFFVLSYVVPMLLFFLLALMTLPK
ncbi:MAG: hypothetical protein WA821_13965 [Anaerolineales bacterium]